MAGSLLAKEVQWPLICPAVLPACGKRYHSKPAEAYRFSRDMCNPRRIGKREVHCASFGGSAPSSVVCAPQQRTVTFYEVLGVSHESSELELKDAYRRRVKEYHPDHAPPEKVQEYHKKFMEVHRAYNMLKDPKRRSIYDFEIKNSLYAANWRYEKRTGQWRGRNWETDQCWTS